MASYREMVLGARKRLQDGEIATAAEIRKLYRRVAEQVRRDVERIPDDSLRRRHLEALAARLDQRAAELRQGLLQATTRGIRIAAAAGTELGRRIFDSLTEGVGFDQVEVRAAFADINERAVLAVTTRTMKDGLKLSDRVWRLTDETKRAITTIIEDAVARGQDPRQTARLLEQYLRPGAAARPLKEETRRRLRVPSDVSMGALRLAVTEMNAAAHEGSVAAYKALPTCEGVYWRLSAVHDVPDVCDDLAAHNGDGFWPIDRVPPLPHPWCRCYTEPALLPPHVVKARLRAWIENPMSEPELEAWYQTNLGRFVRRPRKRTTGTGATTRRGMPDATGAVRALRIWTDIHNRTENVSRETIAAAYDELLQRTREEIVRPLINSLEMDLRPELQRTAVGAILKITFHVGEGVRDSYTVGFVPEVSLRHVGHLLSQLEQAQDDYDRLLLLRAIVFRINDPHVVTAYWRGFAKYVAASFPQDWRAKFRELVEGGSGAALKDEAVDFDRAASYESGIPAALVERAKKAMKSAGAWLKKAIRGPLAEGIPALDAMAVEYEGRSSYSPGFRRMNLRLKPEHSRPLSQEELSADIVHEFAHHIELGGPWGRAVREMMAEAFRRRIPDNGMPAWRAKNDPTEWGYWDEFFRYYLGRVYDMASPGEEIFTMTLQSIHENAVSGLLLDPELATIVLGLIKGVGAP